MQPLERASRSLAAALTVGTAAWLAFTLHRQTNPVEYTNYLSRTMAAIESNQLLENEIVRAGSGTVQDYDPIDHAADLLEAQVRALRATPSFFAPEVRNAVVERIVGLEEAEDFDDRALYLRLLRTERFKAGLARLRAVQTDFTSEAGDLVETLRKPQPDASAELDGLTRDVTRLILTSDPHLANRIDADRGTLSSYVDDPALAPWRDRLQRVGNEAAYIQKAKPDLDGYVNQLLKDPRVFDALSATLGDLQQSYREASERDATRWGIFVALLSATILSISGAVLATVLRQREAIRKEHDRAETLLLNILPASIAAQLKTHPSEIIAKDYADVSVLFADIVGFTPLASKMTPVELVRFLNRVFSSFDRLAEKHGLEKIKTLGDAYMVASGLPEPRADHAEALARMALDMQQEILAFRKEAGEDFGMRIGINSGPVVAGVIGIKKFIYDLWGDAVNVASRMESHGVPNGIHCSDATWQRLKGKGFRFEERGVISVKGKGEMRTWLLIGREDAAAARASVG